MLDVSLYDPPPNKRRPMPKYSILMRLNQPDQLRFVAAVESVMNQTQPDWELVLLGSAEDLARSTVISPQVRTVVCQPSELTGAVVNRERPLLGEWIGFLGQEDLLLPEALAELDAAMLANPLPEVWYTDEESRNWFGQISMRFSKGAFDPVRLRSQEYLRDLTVVHRDLLTAIGGFDLTANACPTHAVYLKAFEHKGESAFGHVPKRLYQRFRDHRQPLPRMDHDLSAIEGHLARMMIPAEVRQLNGGAYIQYQYPDLPMVTVLLIVGDDPVAGLRRIRRSQVGPVYPAASFRVLHLGQDPEAARLYQQECSTLRMRYVRSDLSVPAAVNQQAKLIDTSLMLILQGEAVHPRWLHRLIDHAREPDVGAVGGGCFSGRFLHQPGVLGHAYHDWDWNTAGRFEVLTVSHQVAAVSPACLLIDTRRFLQYQFDPSYPVLYGMELCLRLYADGRFSRWVSPCRIEVERGQIAAPAEIEQLRTAWPAWKDRFGLHLPLQQ